MEGIALLAAALASSRMAEEKRRKHWESLTDEERAVEIAAREKAAAEARERRRAEQAAFVAKSQSKSAKKRSGMTGKAFRRWQKLGRRMARLDTFHDAQEIERLNRLRTALASAPSRHVARMRRVR